MTQDEARDMMLRDALETAIKSEREVIRIKRGLVLCASACVVVASCAAFAHFKGKHLW